MKQSASLIVALAKANAELAAREGLLKQILDTSSVAIFLVDTQGRITQANQRMAEMFGWHVDALEGKQYFELIHPSERVVGRQRMLDLLGSQIPSVDLERSYIRADATEFWGHLTGRRFHGVAGEKLGLLGVIADITDRKQAEMRDQHRSHVLEMLAEKTPLSAVLSVIARNVERIRPAMLCSIILQGDDGQQLREGTGPDAAAPLAELAPRAGLVSCWERSILSAQGKVQGTLLLYPRQAGAPVPADFQWIEDAARLAALAIEKTASEARLQLAASVFTHIREGITITDAKGNIVEVNDTFTQITGYSREEVLGQNPRLLNSGRQGPEFYAAMWQTITATGSWTGEIWNRRKNGEVYAELLSISAVRDTTGTTHHYVAVFMDIMPIKEHQSQLERIAHFDALTGLPNRVLLADRLQQAVAQSQRRDSSLAVAFLDLDGFKAVNDKHGHDVGDALLISVAQRMELALRAGDTLARIGGDEFVAVLVDLEQATDCEPVLTRLLQAAAEPMAVGNAVLQVSASIGVTVYPQDGADADQLMRHADQAMYLAKQAGKNRYHLFDVAHDMAVKTQRDSLAHMRRALEQQEFVLFYQPKVNMKTGVVIGVEALIRWQHPERGLLLPGAFLPIIEDQPISVEVGEWVLTTALNQMTAWRTAGLPMPVSVNIGACQLQQGNFVERLSALLAAHPDVPAGCLELEILETSALQDMAQVSAVMRACRAMGVRFALDDFGTGYSSLTYLKRLSAELLKIDQSFVFGMLEDPDDLAIVKGVIGLATAFRREVIAEGVETAAHGRLLLSLGCEQAQGYGIARPMPASALPQWVATWRPDASWADF